MKVFCKIGVTAKLQNNQALATGIKKHCCYTHQKSNVTINKTETGSFLSRFLMDSDNSATVTIMLSKAE
jgi:hypothetical protein